MISFSSFGDELIKIAQYDPKNRPVNREKFKQFLGNTAMIAAGTGLGYGAAHLVGSGLKRFAGSPASKVRQGLAIGLPVAGGLAVMGYKRELDKEKNRLLEEAYQRGLKRQQQEANA